MTATHLISIFVVIGQSIPLQPVPSPSHAILVSPTARALDDEPKATGPRHDSATEQPTLAAPRDAAPAIFVEPLDTSGQPPASSVAPATFERTTFAGKLVPVEPAAINSPAAELLAEALESPRDAALSGDRVTLLTALGRVADRQQQLHIVKQYWGLSIALAYYHYALDVAERLGQLQPGRERLGQALLKREQTAIQARVQRTRLAALAAQEGLAEALLWPENLAPPLPADRPLTGSYRTRFGALFAERQAPATIRRIVRMLPQQRNLIATEALAVAAAHAYGDTMRGQDELGLRDLSMIIDAYRELDRRRQAFLEAVRDYNFQIADYALHAVDRRLDQREIASMLVSSMSQTQSVLVTSNPVVRAVNNVPLESASHASGRRQDGESRNEESEDPFRDVTPRNASQPRAEPN